MPDDLGEADRNAFRRRLSRLPTGTDEAAAQVRADDWARDNAEAIASFNAYVAEHGAFGAEWRRW